MSTVWTAPVEVPERLSVFLAGGISFCPEWQTEVIVELEEFDFVDIYNPRRSDWDMENPDAEYEQIKWEHDMLRRADIICFWFPCDTLCPITLYELGAWTVQDVPLVIGCHPEYERISDVQIQTELVRPFQEVNIGWDDFIGELKEILS